jgi:hypothetical protein
LCRAVVFHGGVDCVCVGMQAHSPRVGVRWRMSKENPPSVRMAGLVVLPIACKRGKWWPVRLGIVEVPRRVGSSSADRLMWGRVRVGRLLRQLSNDRRQLASGKRGTFGEYNPAATD